MKKEANFIEASESSRKRVLFGVPMTGLIRSEWFLAFTGMAMPTNWSQSAAFHIYPNYCPLRFLVADARNLVTQEAVTRGYEWLIFIDHDVLVPPNLLIKFNHNMIHDKIPLMGGLYFTKSTPADPLIYRGLGNGYFADWKFGKKVWVTGMGLGMHLINVKLLKVLYDSSPTYKLQNNLEVRRVFESPSDAYLGKDGTFLKMAGTEDLPFYKRIIDEKVFEKAGFPSYQKKKYPFLCDTSLFGYHITESGQKYPALNEEKQFV